MTRIPLIALMLASAPALSVAQTPATTDEIPAVVVADSKVARTVDCRGADLTVSGSDDTLAVSRCNTITILGNANHIRAHLLEGSSISAPGNRNVVTWTPAPGWSPRVSATGAGNRIDPEFSPADMRPHPMPKLAGQG